MSSNHVRVSIGLPVYNGENFLDAAIGSILAQTFADFELIVSDNASTDRTEEICRAHAARDPRVRYTRNATNLGASPNFCRTFHLARGAYFKWAAHDDVLLPDYLARCVEVLDRDPSVVLCYPEAAFVDHRGDRVGENAMVLAGVEAAEPHRRFADLILLDHLCLEVFGVMRAEVLGATPLLAPYIGSDRVLLAELGLRGRFHRVPEVLFLSRDHPQRSVRAIPFHFRTEWFDTGRSSPRRGLVLPHWRTFREYAQVLRRVPLPPGQRRACRLHLVRWWLANFNWARVATDLVIAVFPASFDFFMALKRRFYRGWKGWDQIAR